MILNTTNNQNKKMNLLYYPYINLPDTEWTIAPCSTTTM